MEGIVAVTWMDAPGAPAFALMLGPVTDPGLDPYTHFAGYTADTSAVIRIAAPFEAERCRRALLVLSVDEMFLSYHGFAVEPGQNSVSLLEGAEGIFSAIAADSLEIIFGDGGPC